MKKRWIAAVGTALLVATAPSVSAQAVAPAEPEVTAERRRYVIGKAIEVTLMNQAEYELSFENPWRIERRANDGIETVATITWDDTTLTQGEQRTIAWDQRTGDCHNTCDPLDQSREQVPAGRYHAIVDTQDGPVEVAFTVGQHFTLRFESRPKIEFVVFVASQPEVEQMTAEAAAEEKSLIVSGIVRRGRKGYNPEWRFTMGPRSIVLGEVFVEVCDGSPYYIQRHLDEWEGERWCPWSSYVDRVGR